MSPTAISLQPSPTGTPAQPTRTAIPAGSTPTRVATNSVAPTAPPTTTSVAASPTSASNTASTYVDDRDDGAAVIESFYNAINRHEYVRAYSYWEPNAQGLPTYADFEKGYANTASVGVTLGTISGDAGAGQRYYSVPVFLAASNKDGTHQSFVGCYVLHLGSPSAQGVPPFQPLGIRSAQIAVATADKPTPDLLTSACPIQGQVITKTPTPNPSDISNSRYLDDRSGPEGLIRSYYNAINRNEYLRAYSYWEPGSAPSQVPSFADFQKGYAQTGSIELMTGPATEDLGAGQIHNSLPVTLVATMKDGTTQTFVGCYKLHLARPDIQTVPPFQSRGIQSATVKSVPNNTNTATPMAQSCH
jgi:hypothetical protein